MPALLRLNQATIRFGGLTAVNAVDFAVNEGELCGLIGPNGAGKTTVFNLITGVYPPTDGTVAFNCRFGFIRTLTLRNVGLLVDSKPRVIEAVLRQPLARLMRVLELDVASFEDVPLEVLAKHIVEAAPPSLRVVRLLGAPSE